MTPQDLFLFCPRCGERREGKNTQNTVECRQCGLLYHFNPAPAAAAFIFNQNGEALFIRRSKEPARGKLALPGGFVEAGENAEDGVRREVREEVNLEVDSLRYLCSAWNRYHFQEVTYSVLDLFFLAKATSTSPLSALDGVESYLWLKPSLIAPDEIAFGSIREALRTLQHLSPQVESWHTLTFSDKYSDQ